MYAPVRWGYVFSFYSRTMCLVLKQLCEQKLQSFVKERKNLMYLLQSKPNFRRLCFVLENKRALSFKEISYREVNNYSMLNSDISLLWKNCPSLLQNTWPVKQS